MTHYETLGLDPSATADEITDAYRALAKVVHPDRGGDPYMFAVLTEAYDVVGDPEQRAAYDAALAAAAAADDATRRGEIVEPGSWLGPYVPPPGHRRLEDLSLREILFGRRDFRTRPMPSHRSSASGTFAYGHAILRWTFPAIVVAVFLSASSAWFARTIAVAAMLFGISMPFVVAWGSRTARNRAASQTGRR